MLNTETIFRDEFFTPDPKIYKKNLLKKYSNGYLVEYTIEEKFLFIKRKYSLFKPGTCIFYLMWDRNTMTTQRSLRVEEWVEITKDDIRPYRVASIKDAVVEGEALQFVWE